MTRLPVVTAVTAVPEDPSWREVVVDGVAVGRLREADIDRLDAGVGDPWTDEHRTLLAHLVAVDEARKTALRLLGRRDFSRDELHARLATKGHGEEASTEAVDELTRDGWVDDRRYADQVAEHVTGGQPVGEAYVRRKLEARQVAPEVAREAARRVLGDRDPVEDAVDFAASRIERETGTPTGTLTRRVTSALARRGFDEDTIESALARLGLDEEATP